MALQEIRVLSVRQPWAAALLESGKWCDCRSWISHYRGPLFIHSSRWDERPPDDVLSAEPWLRPLFDRPSPLARITGAIIGAVDLVFSAGQQDVDEAYDKLAGQSQRILTPHQVELCKYVPQSPDDSAWDWWNGDGVLIVREPRVLIKPIPIGGKLGIWRLNVRSDRLVFRELKTSRKRRKRKGNRLDDPEE